MEIFPIHHIFVIHKKCYITLFYIQSEYNYFKCFPIYQNRLSADIQSLRTIDSTVDILCLFHYEILFVKIINYTHASCLHTPLKKLSHQNIIKALQLEDIYASWEIFHCFTHHTIAIIFAFSYTWLIFVRIILLTYKIQ